MKTLSIPVEKIDADYLDQLDYAMAFVDEQITSYRMNKEKQILEVDLPDLAETGGIEAKVNELVERYKAREFGLPSVVFFANKKEIADVVPETQELLAALPGLEYMRIAKVGYYSTGKKGRKFDKAPQDVRFFRFAAGYGCVSIKQDAGK